MSTSLLVTEARPVPLAGVRLPEVVDVRLTDGVISQVAPSLPRRPDEQQLDAAGRWVMPGLWDAHVHLGQWAHSRHRLDVSGTAGPAAVVALVSAHLVRTPQPFVVGYGYRSAAWDRAPTVAELDRVSGDSAVVLISGDAHNGWINSRAAAMLGLATPDGLLVEQPWFDALARLEHAMPAADPLAAYRTALHEAAAKGVVGVTDFEFENGPVAWRERAAQGLDLLRVRTAVYADDLDSVLDLGLRTGTALAGELITMGPLKVIFDGSLNTGTAYCHQMYVVGAGSATTGTLNVTGTELTALLRRATAGGLHVAVHAIGDAAVTGALDAIVAAGATGSVEHAQLVAADDLPRFAAAGVTASVQPAHLLDDRDVTSQLWEDRADRCFPLRSLQDAGARLALGSDAPVAPLDPWLALAAAVHRTADDRPAWNAAESLTTAEALRASTNGRHALTAGAPADVVLLDANPLDRTPGVRDQRPHVGATVVAGRVVHLAL